MKTLFILLVVLFCVNQSCGRVARSGTDDPVEGISSTAAPGESTDAPKQVSAILMPGPVLIDEKPDGDSIAGKIDDTNSDSIGALVPQKESLAPSIVKPVSSDKQIADSTNDEVNEGGKDLDIKANTVKPVQNEQTVKNIPEINPSTKNSEDGVKTKTANSVPSQIITNQNKDVINSETKSDNIEDSLKADNIPNLLMPGPVMAGGEVVNDPADTSDRDGAVDPSPDQGISKLTPNLDQVSINKETGHGQIDTKIADPDNMDSSNTIPNNPSTISETKEKKAEVSSQTGTEVKPLLTDSNGQTYLNPNILMPGPVLIEEKTDKSSVSGETDKSVNNTDKNVTKETPAIKPNKDNPSIDSDTTNKITKLQPTDNQTTDNQKNNDIITLTNSIIVSNAKTDKPSPKSEKETIPSNPNNDIDEGNTLTDNLANNDVNGNTIETPDDKSTGDDLLPGDNDYYNQNKEGKDTLVDNTSKNMNPTTLSLDNDNDNKSDQIEDGDKVDGDNQDNLPDDNGMFDDTDNDEADNDVINDNHIDADNGDVDDDTDHVGDNDDDAVDNDIMDDGDQVNDDDDDDDYDYSDDFEENWWDDTDDDNYDDDDDYDDNDVNDYSDDSAVDLDDIAEEVNDDDHDDDDNGDGATRDYDYNGDNDQYDDMLPIDKSHTDTDDDDNEEKDDEKNNINLGDGDQMDLYDDDDEEDDEKNNINLGDGDQIDLYDDDAQENEETGNDEGDADDALINTNDDNAVSDSNDEGDVDKESDETVDEDTGVDNEEGGILTNLDIKTDGGGDDSAVITDTDIVKSSKPSNSGAHFGDTKQWREINTEVKRASAYSWVLFFTVIVITLLFVAYLNKSKLNKFFAPAAPPRRKLGDEEKNLLAYEYD